MMSQTFRIARANSLSPSTHPNDERSPDTLAELTSYPNLLDQLHTPGDVVVLPKGARATARPVGGITKRVFDVLFASCVLVLAMPLLIIIALLIKGFSKGPIVFAHSRVGFRGKAFSCLKFRSMVVDAEKKLSAYLASNPAAAAEWEKDQKLRRDPRVTWIGGILRKSSLDELPQLWNVIRGDMSIVGPRPIIQAELSRYGERRYAYLSARPGMTGLWQVSGRNSTTYDLRTHLDEDYVATWRLSGDLKIIVKTVPELLMSSRAF